MAKQKLIHVLNGPNLNLVGIREPAKYGNMDFDTFLKSLSQIFPEVELQYFQSNIEGELINYLHQVGLSSFGIVLNPGAYTHTSVAIADAIAAIEAPVIEVHISNIVGREDFRHKSLSAPYCKGSIMGLGLDGYRLAISNLLST